MMIPEDNPEQLIRTEDAILADIWGALRKEEAIRSMDMGSLSIEVKYGEVYLSGYLKEEYQPLVDSIIHSVLGVTEVHNHLRTDDGILADIWDALWKIDTFRSLDLGSLSVDVRHGEVYLDGHLSQENNRLQIESIVRSVAGVVAVHSHLVLDRDVIIQVAQALANDERTRPYFLPVDAFHGWIHVGGEVPTCALQQIVEKVAGGVPGVRGVTIPPRIAGENPKIPQHSVQPRIGAVVYGKDSEVGIVTHVVIRPDNRLVTHVVIRSRTLRDGNLVVRENVVPLEAIDLVKNESIFLNRNGPSLNAYPALDADEYPLAEYTWQAPYPYSAGEVRWSLRETLEAISQPAYQPELKPGAEVAWASKQAIAQAGA